MPFFENASIWLVALAIFLARIADVSLGTMRMISVIHGHITTAVTLGFFEILIWVVAVSGVIVNITEYPLLIVAYAGGFAAGNAVGIFLERKLAMGACVATLISSGDGGAIAAALRQIGQRVTTVEAEGRDGPRQIIYATAKRRDVRKLLGAARAVDPDVFYFVQFCSETSRLGGLAYAFRGGRGGVKHK
jgi:uncharacterized protein YebE (UPF0316 family)